MSARRNIGARGPLLADGWVALILAAAPADARPCATDPDIALTDTGLEPSSVCILPGASIHWTNGASDTQDVVEPTGRFNSGHLQPGAGFSITLGVPGTHLYRSTLSAGFEGEIVVAMEGLDGPLDELANDWIPDVAYPAQLDEDLSIHPLGLELTSRTRLMLGFTDEATVGEANAALATAEVVVLGGLPRMGMLLVASEDSGDFTALEVAQATLESMPGVEFAGEVTVLSTDVVPRPPDAATRTILAAEGAALMPPPGEDPGGVDWQVIRTTTDGPYGRGANWPLEASRVPQIWNWREELLRGGHGGPAGDVATVFVDKGYETSHPDLAGAVIPATVCVSTPSGSICTPANTDSHGLLTTGVLAARYDNDAVEAGRSLGVSGVNPVAQAHALVWGFDELTPSTAPSMYQVLDKAVEQIPDIRVINMSISTPSSTAATGNWWTDPKKGATDNCRPGLDDDGDKGGGPTSVCTLNNNDWWLKKVRRAGLEALRISRRLAVAGVVVIKSGGNSSDSLCMDKAKGFPCSENQTDGWDVHAANNSGFNWAAGNWSDDTLPNPIIRVEAVRETGLAGSRVARSHYSSDQGDISAPADVFGALKLNGTYHLKKKGGTSSAAPFVAGVVGQLVTFEPDLTIPQIRDHLLTWSRDDVDEGGAPRVDAFASMLSIPGAARALVDVNDESLDGNRRVIRGPGDANLPGGAELGPDLESSSETNEIDGKLFRTAPDGVIDMRDFRRFRDARVLVCSHGDLAQCDLSSADLDGAGDHPKNDLNFDGCVHDPANPDLCTVESYHSRFDFNGDGVISRSDAWPVPLLPDGTVAPEPNAATPMTDLQVMASQWNSNLDETEGYGPGDLERLLDSFDVLLYADQFFDGGATSVEVQFQDKATGEMFPRREILAGEYIVYTLPTGATWQVEATGAIAGQLVTAEPAEVNILSAGTDFRVDLCTRSISLSATPLVLRADGSSESVLHVTVQACNDDAIQIEDDPQAVFTATPSGEGHGEVVFASVGLGPDLTATNTFRAGTEVAEYVVTATVTVDSGDGTPVVLEDSVVLETIEAERIFYHWQQEVLGFDYSGSSRWPPGIPDAPSASGEQGDCDHPQGGWIKCVEFFSMRVFASPFDPHLSREGVLTPQADGVVVDETVTASVITGSFNFRTGRSTPPLGPVIDQLTGTWRAEVAADDRSQYQSHPLPPEVEIHFETDGVRLDGLRALGDLPYSYESTWTRTGTILEDILIENEVGTSVSNGGITTGLEIYAPGVAQPELMLVPRADGSSFQLGEGSGSVVFPPAPNGSGHQKYSYCEVIERDEQSPPNYYSTLDLHHDLGFAKGLWKRAVFFEPIGNPDGLVPSSFHEYPMPVGPVSSRMRYSFVAIPFTSDAELAAMRDAGELDLPSCQSGSVPSASFTVNPNPGDEGSVVEFADTSTSAGNSIVAWQWDFGDGEPSTDPFPSHLYEDDGDYEVTLTITDASGATDVETVEVVIDNRPPLAEIDDAFAFEGQAAQLIARIGDPGAQDQAFLTVDLVSQTGAWDPIERILPGGIHPFLLVGLSAGTYPLTLTVTDKDGGVTSDDAELRILGDGEDPPEPPPQPFPTPTCDPTVSLDGEEQAFLDRLNDYRADAGAGPLEASPALTRAAARHASDMASGGFLSHVGSDGSTPGQRAEEAGYFSMDVEENLLSGLSQASNALFAWIASSEHNANLLNPDWTAVGIARAEGEDWYWATDFGEESDCPLNAGFAASSDILLASSAVRSRSRAPAPGISDDVRVMASGSGSGGSSVLGATSMVVLSGMVNLNALTQIAQALPGPVPRPVAALAISALSVETGQLVMIRNRSRDHFGSPIPATIDPGDGSQPLDLPADGSFTHAYAQVGTYEVTLSATDLGATTSVARSIEVLDPAPPDGDPDFNLTLFPSSHVMAPGTSVNFVVSVAPVFGFDAPVTLTVSPLPAGVTATLDESVLTPSASTVLTIAAATDAGVGDFEVQVTAEGGGQSHSTASDFRLDFGLVPICKGAFTGRVTDVETGEPLPNVTVAQSWSNTHPNNFVQANAEGYYTHTNINLGPGNTPVLSGLEARFAFYFPGVAGAVVACGEVTELNIQMLAAKTSTVGGRVVVGVPDPDNLEHPRDVTPSDEPIEGASFRVAFHPNALTDSDGRYLRDGLFLNPGNEPREYFGEVFAADHWPSGRREFTVQADQTTVQDFALVPICHTSLSVTILHRDGEPVSGMGLNLFNGPFREGYLTDENGHFDALPQRLDYNNSVTSYRVVSPATDTREALNAFIKATECDEQIEALLIVDRRQERRGDLVGVVTDSETGEPIPGAHVLVSSLVSQETLADASGAYRLEGVLVGYDDVDSQGVILRGSANGYFQVSRVVTLFAETSTQEDLELLRIQTGAFEMIVRDIVTGDPIESAIARGTGFTIVTDADGFASKDGLSLLPGNAPRSYGLEVDHNAYWPTDTTVLVSAGETTQIEVELLPVCEGATVVGSVSNAANGEPLEEVQITLRGGAGGFNGSQGVFGTKTDADGNYVLANITVGTDNSPASVQVVATKPGFETQSKVATIFCGARITIEFGQPPGELGAIEGTVTDDAGTPMSGVFIGSGFGATTSTDAAGYYHLGEVPLGPGDADREWEITADPDDLDSQTRPVVASAGETVRLDFVFGDNQAPVADAGADQNATTGAPVVLDGSDSFDPDGDMIGFDWSLERGSKPEASQLGDADITDRTTPTPEFTPDVDGTYEVELIVADDELQSEPDTVKVEATSPNVPPNADAGPDQNAFLGDAVQLDASASHDPDGGPEPLAFQWRFFAVPGTSVLEEADISTSDAPFAEFTPDVAGTYAVDVEVDDGLDSDSDTVEIVVVLPNVPPNADAGEDTAAVLGTLVTLDGSGSEDPDNGPDLLTYAWRFVSIPAGSSLTNADIADADTAEPTFTPDVPGAYVLELGVDDGEDADFDNAMVEVLPPNLPEPVFDLVARAKPEKIDLVWTPVPGAAGYDIYRSFSEGGPYERIAEGYVTNYAAYADFELTDGTPHFYVVRSVDAAGQRSEDSNEASATPGSRSR